jgi:hypothetical protein
MAKISNNVNRNLKFCTSHMIVQELKKQNPKSYILKELMLVETLKKSTEKYIKRIFLVI